MVQIKFIELNPDISNVSCTYIPSVKTYNIVTINMSDDCKPIQIGNGCCIWINERGQLGEIECVYPKHIENDTLIYSLIGECIDGIPSLEISSYDDNIVVEQIENGFIIWFSKVEKVEQEVLQNGISYLISENQLLGIVAKNYDIIE